MDIQTFRLPRAMGKGHWSSIPGLEPHEKALNEIGYTGKLNGESITIQGYLDKYFSGDIQYNATVISTNMFEYTDLYFIVRVKI